MSNRPVSSLANKHILVVDDMPANLKLLGGLLKKQGYCVQLAISGKLALRSLDLAPPDLVLLDINMPEMDGYEVCVELKKRSGCQDVPVIFISALDETSHKLKGFEVGGVDYITKPFQQAEVLARVQTQLKLQEMKLQLLSQNSQLKQEIKHREKTEKQLVEAEKMASLGRLVSGVAHEINTPLGIAITAVSSLKNTAKKCRHSLSSGQLKRSELTEFVKHVDDIEHLSSKSLQKAAELVRNFKQVAVTLSGEKRSRFNLKQHLELVIAGFSEELQSQVHNIHLSCSDNIELYTYPDVLLQIGRQLISNSFLHGFEHKQQGNILISVLVKSDQVTLEFQDNGQGMTAEQVLSIFEPFYTTKRNVGMTGLGMHITYNQITQILGGTITCSSSPDLGAEFILQFPDGLQWCQEEMVKVDD